MPVSTQHAQAISSSARLPRNGTWKTRRTTVSASAVMPMTRTNSGSTLAATTWSALAGVISSCSTVPRSFSLIIVAAATSEAFSVMSVPRTPVTVNQAWTRPGL